MGRIIQDSLDLFKYALGEKKLKNVMIFPTSLQFETNAVTLILMN